MALATRSNPSKSVMNALQDAGASQQILDIARSLIYDYNVSPNLVMSTALQGLPALIRLNSATVMAAQAAQVEDEQPNLVNDWRQEYRGGRPIQVRGAPRAVDQGPDFDRLVNFHVDRVRQEMRQEFRGHMARMQQQQQQILVKADSLNERGTPSGYGVLQMILDTSPAAAGASAGVLANLPYPLFGVGLLLEDGGIVTTVNSVIVDGVTQTLGPNTTAAIPGSILDANTFHRNAIWAGDIRTSLTVNATVSGAGRWWIYTVAQPGIELNPRRVSPCCPPNGRAARRPGFRTPDVDGGGYDGEDGYELPEPIYRG